MLLGGLSPQSRWVTALRNATPAGARVITDRAEAMRYFASIGSRN